MECILRPFWRSIACCVGGKGRGSTNWWKIAQYKFREAQSQFSYWNTEQKGIVKSKSTVAHTPRFHRWVRGFSIAKAVMGQEIAVSFCTGTVSIYFGWEMVFYSSLHFLIKFCVAWLSSTRYCKVHWEKNCHVATFQDLNFLEKFMNNCLKFFLRDDLVLYSLSIHSVGNWSLEEYPIIFHFALQLCENLRRIFLYWGQRKNRCSLKQCKVRENIPDCITGVILLSVGAAKSES